MFSFPIDRDPRRRKRPRRGLTLASAVGAAATVTLLAAGCSSSGSSTSASSPTASASTSAAAPTSAAASSPAAQGGASAVTATETEFHIALSTTTFKAGTYKFTAVNKGSFSHNLIINGPGVSQAKTPGLLAAGQSGSVTVTLQAGTYDIYCGVPGHKAQGMDVKITVS
ncbi:MAG TPA: cupredoxin domain-containing protein [Streptosporangiaceae bacterium]